MRPVQRSRHVDVLRTLTAEDESNVGGLFQRRFTRKQARRRLASSVRLQGGHHVGGRGTDNGETMFEVRAAGRSGEAEVGKIGRLASPEGRVHAQHRRIEGSGCPAGHDENMKRSCGRHGRWRVRGRFHHEMRVRAAEAKRTDADHAPARRPGLA